MPHMIDETTGAPAIAYVGETPWHGLGRKLTAGSSIEQWTEQARLAWNVMRSPVLYTDQRDPDYMPSLKFTDRHVLYRSDTGKPLGIVSSNYKIVQPADVMGFFGELTALGGFQMETAGALSDGKRIWALARISDGAPIIGHDIVRPYLLLSTSYDTSSATIAKLTAIRVVCNNTLTASLNTGHGKVGKAVSTTVSVGHAASFDAKAVRLQLGVFENAFDKWLIQTRILAEKKMDLDAAGKLTAKLMGEMAPAFPVNGVVDVAKSKGYRRIMELFDGAAIGTDLTGGFSRWDWVNSVTQWIDHERGNSNATRLSSAWFGTGDRLKSRAYDLAVTA